MRWIRRQRYFMDFTLASMWRRKARNGALLLVYTFVVFTIASVLFFVGALRREAALILEEAPDLVVQRMMAGRHDLMPVGYVETVAAIRGARSVRPRLWGYYFHPASGCNYTLMVPEEFPHGEDRAVVGEGVLRTWRAAKGERLYFRTFQGEAAALEVADVLDGTTALVTSDLVLVSESSFRRIFGMPAGYATDLAVSVRNPSEWRTVAEKINLALPDTRPILREEILRTYAAVFDWRSGMVLVLLSSAVLAFFIFAWDRATGLSARERYEIGVLKGVGWDTADVLLVKVWEGLVVSLAAFLLGTAAAYLHVFVARAPLFEQALKGWGVLYPDFRLRPDVDGYQLGVLFFLVVMPYTLLTIVPSWRAAIADPDAVMRQA